jgi:SAM-dependent methyltransferase
MLDDSLPGIAAKRREMAGWVELAKRQAWYEPADDVDLALPFLSRDLGWDDDVWRATEHSFSVLLDCFVRPGMRVLEVGAGKCWAARHLVPLGCDYVATDLVADASIGLGRGVLYERRVGPFARVQADGEHLPFADRSFDLAYTVAALHHALDPARMTRELARVTRRGGVVAALNEGTRPLRWSPDNPDQEIERELGINERVHTLPGYVSSFLRAGLFPVRLERSDGRAPFAGRPRLQKLLRLPGGRTALTVALNVRAGYSGISLYARRLV